MKIEKTQNLKKKPYIDSNVIKNTNNIFEKLTERNQDPQEELDRKPQFKFMKFKKDKINPYQILFDHLMELKEWDDFKYREYPDIFDYLCSNPFSSYTRIIKNNINSQNIDDKLNFLQGLPNPNLHRQHIKNKKFNLFDLGKKNKRRISHDQNDNKISLLNNRLSQFQWGYKEDLSRLRFANIAQQKLENPQIFNPHKPFNLIDLNLYKLHDANVLKEKLARQSLNFMVQNSIIDEPNRRRNRNEKIVEFSFCEIEFLIDLKCNLSDIQDKFLCPSSRLKIQKENPFEECFYKLIDYQNMGITKFVYKSLFNQNKLLKAVLRHALAIGQNQKTSNRIVSFLDLIKNKDRRNNQFTLYRVQHSINLLYFDILLTFMISKSEQLIQKFKQSKFEFLTKLHSFNEKFLDVQKFVFDSMQNNFNKLTKQYSIFKEKQNKLMENEFEAVFQDFNHETEQYKIIKFKSGFEQKLFKNIISKVAIQNLKKFVKHENENKKPKSIQHISSKANMITQKLLQKAPETTDREITLISNSIKFQDSTPSMQRSKSTLDKIKFKSQDQNNRDQVNSYMIPSMNSPYLEEIQNKQSGNLNQRMNLQRIRENQVNDKQGSLKYFNNRKGNKYGSQSKLR